MHALKTVSLNKFLLPLQNKQTERASSSSLVIMPPRKQTSQPRSFALALVTNLNMYTRKFIINFSF